MRSKSQQQNYKTPPPKKKNQITIFNQRSQKTILSILHRLLLKNLAIPLFSYCPYSAKLCSLPHNPITMTSQQPLHIVNKLVTWPGITQSTQKAVKAIHTTCEQKKGILSLFFSLQPQNQTLFLS